MENFLEIAELLKVELNGKKAAMGRYDQILWKIRSGYLVALAGALGFFVTKGPTVTITPLILIIILWFSLAAWAIDITFRRRQLRVVKAYNYLVSSAIRNLPGEVGLNHIPINLFHISGENLKFNEDFKDIPVSICLTPSVYIYLGTTCISLLLFYLQPS